MRARTGLVRIWHWAHLEADPNCASALESEWHLAWKDLGADGSQEVRVGNRRADVLAPGGYAVEFQASSAGAEEVCAREADWAVQGGMVWVFRADREFAAGRIVLSGSFRGWDACLLKPETRSTLDVTWLRAPERVRAARAPSFLDLGEDDEMLFIGGWRDWSSPLTGYGWRVSRNWVVDHVLRGDVVPGPLAGDPAEVKRRLAEWQRRVDKEDRLEHPERRDASLDETKREGRRNSARLVRQEELRARKAALARPGSGSEVSPPTPGSVITPRLRAWRLAREAERARGREDEDGQPQE